MILVVVKHVDGKLWHGLTSVWLCSFQFLDNYYVTSVVENGHGAAVMCIFLSVSSQFLLLFILVVSRLSLYFVFLCLSNCPFVFRRLFLCFFFLLFAFSFLFLFIVSSYVWFCLSLTLSLCVHLCV